MACETVVVLSAAAERPEEQPGPGFSFENDRDRQLLQSIRELVQVQEERIEEILQQYFESREQCRIDSCCAVKSALDPIEDGTQQLEQPIGKPVVQFGNPEDVSCRDLDQLADASRGDRQISPADSKAGDGLLTSSATFVAEAKTSIVQILHSTMTVSEERVEEFEAEFTAEIGTEADMHEIVDKSRIARFCLSTNEAILTSSMTILACVFSGLQSNCRLRSLGWSPELLDGEVPCHHRISYWGEFACFCYFAVYDVIGAIVWRRVAAKKSAIYYCLFMAMCTLSSLMYFISDSTPNLTCMRIVLTISWMKYIGLDWLAEVMHHIVRIVRAFCSSIACLVSAIVVLVISMYLFSTLLAFCLDEEIQRADIDVMKKFTESERQDLEKYFGSLKRTMLSLSMIMFGGEEWRDMFERLSSVSDRLGLFFLGYIVFTSVGLLNVVTSLFVEATLNTSAANLAAQQHDEISLVNKLKACLKRTIGNSDTVSWEDLYAHIKDNSIKEFSTNIDLGMAELRSAFQIMDHERTGELSISDFVWGCMRVKGMAKSIDVCKILNEQRQSKKILESSLHELSNKMQHLEHAVSGHQAQATRSSLKKKGACPVAPISKKSPMVL